MDGDFAQFLQRDQARIYGYLHALVRDANDADDLFQQTTMILWKKFGEYDRSRSFFSWACGIARGEVANFLRTRSRSKLYFSDEVNARLAESAEELEAEEIESRKQALASCLEKLRQRDRELLLACYDGTKSITEVAEREGRSSQSVHNTLKRIRLALFECVQQELDNP
jgi:RNA polymerase sigma-70 factor, ECF subfamily